ncbi:MAG: SgcJ/EcaC family oxidoreductase [Planctomycetes bacterium]|nr:SgcJ/EcaC family oxidoreductase [Planctomycetota bacterium]
MSPDERSLRDTVAAWIRASQAEDAQALSQLVAPDAVFLAPGKAPVVGREAWAAARSPLFHGVQLRLDLEQVVVYGDWGHAWCEIRMSVPHAEGEPDVRIEGHTLGLYRRNESGKWLLAREATQLAPAR